MKDVTWDVKKGEKVGLVGVNGAGKTTQLQIITGALQQDAGNVIKAKENMRIAYLTQEFDVTPTNTVREEFMSAFGEQVNGLWQLPCLAPSVLLLAYIHCITQDSSISSSSSKN